MSEPVTVDISRIAGRGKLRNRPKGRAVDPAARAEVRALLGDAPRRRDLLIEHLHRIQDRYGHLSAAHLAALAEEMRLAQAEVYEVATFYHHFDVVKEGEAPPPPLTVRVCETLSCAMAGARRSCATLLAHARAATCASSARRASGAASTRRPRSSGRMPDRPQRRRRRSRDAVRPPRRRRRAGVRRPTPRTARRAATGRSRECVAGKRDAEDGHHDAGRRRRCAAWAARAFRPGASGRSCAPSRAPRLMAVNIDEGEPGTFKDRHYLERDPHRFLEGMLIAAWAVGIERIYIYLRDEYAGMPRDARRASSRRSTADPPCALPPIDLRRGAGAYICGEESAMIESIEGKRGMPRLRPPYVAQVGLFGRPTLEHNMETLYWVRDIVEKGADWFAGQGRHGRKGLRSFSVSGRVKKPGVHLAPAGITARELIDEYCGGMLDGHEFYAYLPGGASGGILPASMGDIPLDFDTLQPHGCFIGSAAVDRSCRSTTARATPR